LVNAGIYILSPEIFDHVVPGERLDMTELVERLLRNGKRVASFPIREKWIDIGRHSDYDLANEEPHF
jgi:NDP-sugar pyrophosphorylase family protein